jgi:hypothetical protein
VKSTRKAKRAAPLVSPPKHKSLRDLLASPKNPNWRGGIKCQTCALTNVKAVNDDLLLFVEARAKGHPMPWKAFVREWLAPTYAYPYTPNALRHHATKCLGVTDVG